MFLLVTQGNVHMVRHLFIHDSGDPGPSAAWSLSFEIHFLTRRQGQFTSLPAHLSIITPASLLRD